MTRRRHRAADESKAKHILMLLSNPYVHDVRVKKEAHSLRAHGYRITVLAWDRSGTNAIEEEVESVHVRRIRNRGVLRMIPLDILRLPTLWRRFAAIANQIHAEQPVDAVHAHDLDTLPAGVRIAESLGVPLVFDAHEIWPYMIHRDLPFLVPTIFERIEKRLLPRVDAIVTVSPQLEEYYTTLTSAPEKIHVVLNSRNPHVDSYQRPNNQKLTILYIGSISPQRFLEGAIQAVRGLDGVRLIIGGIGKPRRVKRIQKMAEREPNATFIGVVHPSDVLEMTLKSDIVLCMMDPKDRNDRLASANKQFEAMACGRPIICSEGTAIGAFTKANNTGIVVHHSVEGIRSALNALLAEDAMLEAMGKQAISLIHDGLDWDRQAEVLAKVYTALWAAD